MSNISKEQYRLLKKIQRMESISPNSLTDNELNICKFLSDKGFLSVTNKYQKTSDGNLNIFSSSPSEYSITQSGKAEIYIFKSTFYKWWIPVVISIAALIVSISLPILERLL